MEEKKEENQENCIIKIDDLSQSAVLKPITKLEPHNIDIPDYIDDFLQISPDAVFINGNRTALPKKKKIKKIIKKKIKKSSINNNEKQKESQIIKSKKEDIKSEKIKSEEKDKTKENKNDNALPKINTHDINKNISIEKINKEENKALANISNDKLNNSEEKKKINENINNKNKKIKNLSNKNEIIKKEKEEDIEKRISIINKIKSIVKSKILYELISSLKIIYFFKKLKNYQINSTTKISSIYRGYTYRDNLRLNYLTQKILKYRDLCCSKIIAHYKGYFLRKLSKKIIQKKEDFYIIYSSLANNKMLYFKVKYSSGLEENLYFEFCKLLKCFVYYISRKEKNSSKKKVEGFFYNEKYHKLTDDMYEKNQKGENILNFPKIIKKTDENNDKYDKVINEYIKAHRQVTRKRENLDEYEERKKKALDDDMILHHKKFGEKLNKMSRSKSFMRLKGVMKNKGILKPSKSYINLRTDDKKIQFGKAKIKGYHNLKK